MRKQESCKVIKCESSNRANTALLANLQTSLIELHRSKLRKSFIDDSHSEVHMRQHDSLNVCQIATCLRATMWSFVEGKSCSMTRWMNGPESIPRFKLSVPME